MVEVLERSVGEEGCREVLWRSVVEKSVVGKCCERVLWRRVVEEC